MTDAWPSAQQRRNVAVLAEYHPQLYATWKERLDRALARKGLSRHDEEVLVVGIVAVLHFAPDVIEAHLEAALDAGSNVQELLELVLRIGVQEGQHAQSSGGEALWTVVERRTAEGRPCPMRGTPLGPEDLIPHSPWKPVKFPFQTPHPRTWQAAVPLWDPERAAITEKRNAEIATLAPQLSTRLRELCDSSVDVVVRWKAPRIDHHMHEALHCGSNVQELLELFMVSAEVAQGARESNVSGRQVESGVEILRYGLAALDRVVGERAAVGEPTRMDHATTRR